MVLYLFIFLCLNSKGVSLALELNSKTLESPIVPLYTICGQSRWMWLFSALYAFHSRYIHKSRKFMFFVYPTPKIFKVVNPESTKCASFSSFFPASRWMQDHFQLATNFHSRIIYYLNSEFPGWHSHKVTLTSLYIS